MSVTSNPFPVYNPIKLYIAVITTATQQVVNHKDVDQHEIGLENILMTSADFKSLFFPTGNFAIPSLSTCINNLQQTSIMEIHRKKQGGMPFCLIDEIIASIETDTGFPVSMLSPCSVIGLTREITAIKTLSDLASSTVNCKLTWDEILNALWCELMDPTTNQLPSTVPAILTIVLRFTTQTNIPNAAGTGFMVINPTVVELNYAVTFSASDFNSVFPFSVVPHN